MKALGSHKAGKLESGEDMPLSLPASKLSSSISVGWAVPTDLMKIVLESIKFHVSAATGRERPA